MSQDEIILTPQSKKRLEEELSHIRMVKRPEVTESISRAREYGDLSENFEYQAAKQAQAILNGRVAELEAILARARVEENATNGDIVSLGAMVTVYDAEIEEDWTFTIVDATSADPEKDLISYASPVGKAAMKKRVGDVIQVELPAGKIEYKITGLQYE